MAKIYSVPEGITVPEIKFDGKFDFKEYCKEVDKFCKELAAILKKRNPNGECVGEVIDFPVADGKAKYMVAGLKPVELVHLPLDDAWHFEYANRLTAKDVRDKISAQKALEKLFSKKKGE